MRSKLSYSEIQFNVTAEPDPSAGEFHCFKTLDWIKCLCRKGIFVFVFSRYLVIFRSRKKDKGYINKASLQFFIVNFYSNWKTFWSAESDHDNTECNTGNQTKILIDTSEIEIEKTKWECFLGSNSQSSFLINKDWCCCPNIHRRFQQSSQSYPTGDGLTECEENVRG